MNEIAKRFIESYEYLRKSNKVSNAKDFANKLKVSESLVSDIKNKRSNPGVPVLQSLSKVFNISSEWLLTGTGSMFVETNYKNVPYDDSEYNLKDLILYFAKKQKITIKELAKQIGMSEANIYLRFKKNSMELEHLQKIADTLKIPIENLVSNNINIVGENQIFYQQSKNNSPNNINISDKNMELLQLELDNLREKIEMQREKISYLSENIASLKKIIEMLENK